MNPHAVWIVDVNTQKFLAVNHAASVRYGYSKSEFLRMHIADIHLPSDLDDLREFLDLASTSPMLTERQHIWRHRVKSGKVVLVDSTVCRLLFESRMALLFVVMDESEHQQAESRLRRAHAKLEASLAEKARELELAANVLDSFSYLVSHDMRSPLLVIDGFAQELLDMHGGPLDEQGVHFATRIRKSAQHMSQLIEEMLLLAKVTRVPLEREAVDLSALCAEVAATLQASDPQRSVNIEIRPDMWLDGDPGLIRLVVQNLLENAWKFTSKRSDPWISVGCEESGDHPGPVVVVSDNGAGFDMAQANKLFIAFRRLHSTREFPGTGVGLAIAHRIVTRHGGSIWAESQQGVGSSFHFTLGPDPGPTRPAAHPDATEAGDKP